MAIALQIRSKDASETRKVSVDYTDKLDSGETLSGTVTVAEQDTTDLTLTGSGVNSSSMTINGRTVAADSSVSFTVAGGTVGKVYVVQITVDTSNSQTFVDDVKLQVV
mgnify:FL=1|tara:strand:- start:477 stop:800 length:324 start_codon:yes stop_codon:yes gene_type:complete